MDWSICLDSTNLLEAMILENSTYSSKVCIQEGKGGPEIYKLLQNANNAVRSAFIGQNPASSINKNPVADSYCLEVLHRNGLGDWHDMSE